MVMQLSSKPWLLDRATSVRIAQLTEQESSQHTNGYFGKPHTIAPYVAQYADIGHESAPNRVRFGSGPVPGRHPVLGDGIGGLRQLGAEPAH